jgi:cell division protein ZipA
MEFSVREWTIIVGVLLIVAVFLDGYRRVRNERSNRIRISLSKQVFNQQPVATSELPDAANSELPNGGARVIGKRREDLHLQQSVPVLIEPVAVAPISVTSPPQNESITQQISQPIEGEPIDQLLVAEPELQHEAELPLALSDARVEPRFNAQNLFDDDEEQKAAPPEKPARKFFARKDSIVAAEPEPEPVEAQEVLIVNVLCKDAEGFKGPDLLQLLLACDLRFGKKNIFHRYEKANAKGAVQFSVANLVEPGIFDLDAIDNFSTPGVSFFLSLPGPEQPVTAFNYMVETAQVLVRHLHAELRDDAQSVMTAQTIEHCRQRIRDFERKQLTLQL